MRKKNLAIVAMSAGLAGYGLYRLAGQPVGKRAYWPLGDWPRKLTSAYGIRRSGMHSGADYAAPVGTPVYSPDAGIATRRDNERGGIVLAIESANGWSYGMAHLSEVLVDDGERIQQGQLVALTGMTGNTTGPHLHLMIRSPSGALVDPQSFTWLYPSPSKGSGNS